jgi:hypothetical protein
MISRNSASAASPRRWCLYRRLRSGGRGLASVDCLFARWSVDRIGNAGVSSATGDRGDVWVLVVMITTAEDRR